MQSENLQTHILKEEKLTQIMREYDRFLTTDKMLKTLYQFCQTEKEKYEIRNALERWLLTSANYEKSQDAVYVFEIVNDINHPVNQKMIHEIMEKKICMFGKAVMEEMLALPLAFLNRGFESEVKSEIKSEAMSITKNNRMVTIGFMDYSKNIADDRFKVLMSKGTLEDILLASLRYSSIISYAQHWTMPPDVYQNYTTKYGVNVEGFASPFNSQLIMINPEAKFCSIFKDTDAVFGSLGNFFEADFQNCTVAINPPYVLEIMNKMAYKCLQECLKAQTQKNTARFLIIFSAWKDTDAFQLLRDTAFKRYYYELYPGKHYYVDANDVNSSGQRKEIVARFTTCFFVLSQGLNDKVSDYYHALDPMTLQKKNNRRL